METSSVTRNHTFMALLLTIIVVLNATFCKHENTVKWQRECQLHNVDAKMTYTGILLTSVTQSHGSRSVHQVDYRCGSLKNFPALH